MSYEMKLEQGLSQQLNQFQVQSLKILSFDNYELEKFLQDEYAENPLMEQGIWKGILYIAWKCRRISGY